MNEQEFGFETQAIRTQNERTQFLEHSTPLYLTSSFVFEDAIAQVPMTLPSHTSILTGLLPPAHGVRDNAGFILDSKVNTLAEILKSKNYKTAAFISAFVLD